MRIIEIFESAVLDLSKNIVKAGRVGTRGCECFAKPRHRTVLALVPVGTKKTHDGVSIKDSFGPFRIH
jgi:hypothetical protein